MTVKDLTMSEICRLSLVLPTLDPIKDAALYEKILDNINSLAYLPLGENWADERNEINIEPPAPAEHPVDNVTPFPEPSTEEYAAPVMSGKQVGVGLSKDKLDDAPTEEPEKTYAKEDVRAALAKARKKGINVTEFLGEFGVENFTGLPAAKYPEVMAKLEAL